MVTEIPLYKLPYFSQGNTMIGSCTPEDAIGDVFADIFNYRVSYGKEEIKNEAGEATENRVFIRALYFIDSKCYELTDKSKVVTKDFEPSDEGIEEASKWLLNEYNKYLRTV